MKTSTRNLTLSAMFLAIAQVLPFITGQIPMIGKMLCPMHLPVMLCGFFCPWQYALAVGLISPLLRSVLFGMPALYPSAVGMAFELASYALIIALLSGKLGKDKMWKLYVALITAMLGGRIVWGVMQVILLGIKGDSFTFSAFWAGGFVNAFPGIILQLILIPLLVKLFIKRVNSNLSVTN